VQDWLAELLLRKLDIVPSRESSVLEISFEGADPAFVAAVANAFADEYEKLSVQLKTEPMKKATTYFDGQTRQLRDNLEAAQARLSKYQQEKGIVSLDNNRVDVELSRLNDLSAQMVAAQAQSIEAGSRERMASGASANAPDVTNNGMVQSLRISLGLAESKLAELGQRLAPNHPQYVASKAEVDQLRSAYRGAVSNVSSSVGNNAEVLRQRENELRSAVAAQKTKVLELNRARDELGVLLKDVESAQRAFDTTSQRLSQTRIEGQSEQSDISVLNPATAPIEADGPRVLFNTLVSVLLGTMLGVAIAMLYEMLNRPIRSSGDLRDSLGIPVLGTIEWTPPRRHRGKGLKNLLNPRRLRLTN
jgi:chain length determinant protein EpsF